jgi:hypothetical protein
MVAARNDIIGYMALRALDQVIGKMSNKTKEY